MSQHVQTSPAFLSFADAERSPLSIRARALVFFDPRCCEGKPERRRGVDVMHFRDGLIIKKYTYSKTTLEIGGERVKLTAGNS
jgi:hypothetical protein